MNDRPGLVGAVRGYRYVRARVISIDIAPTPGALARITANALNDSRTYFVGDVPVADCPRVDALVTFAAFDDGAAELVISRDPIEHEVKCAPDPFAALASGDKRHEVRVNDRDYRVGDSLLLNEYGPAGYTGNVLRRRVTHITPGGSWGLPEGLCVLSVAPIEAVRDLLDQLEAIMRASGEVLHGDAGGRLVLSAEGISPPWSIQYDREAKP